MAKCRRDGCNNPVFRNRAALKERLCERHYAVFLFNQSNRNRRLNTKCAYESCQNNLGGTRNEKYCSARCRQKASRKLDSNQLDSILASSYWRNIGNSIKRNPLMLGSINEMKDLTILYSLYVHKAGYQRSYAIPAYDGYEGPLKPVPLIPLELCHLYPNGKGGENTGRNIIIGPRFINRKNNDQIPFQSNGFSGIRAKNGKILIERSLFDTLVALHGQQVVMDALQEIIPAKRFYGNVPRPITFRGIQEEMPFFTLLHCELWRLGYCDMAICLGDIKSLFSHHYPLYLELLAIAGFDAILSGDPDGIMMRIHQLFYCFFEEHPRRYFKSRTHNRYLKIMYLLLRRYLKENFEIELTDRKSVVKFYNVFYSKSVIDVGKEPDVLNCISFDSGRERISTIPFYNPVKKAMSSDDLSLLSGTPLDICLPEGSSPELL